MISIGSAIYLMSQDISSLYESFVHTQSANNDELIINILTMISELFKMRKLFNNIDS